LPRQSVNYVNGLVPRVWINGIYFNWTALAWNPASAYFRGFLYVPYESEVRPLFGHRPAARVGVDARDRLNAGSAEAGKSLR
jgi:hypothetical protein